MLQAFVIMLREGFEAFLIVAIIVSYLKKTQQTALFGAVSWGVVVSIAASIAMGFVLARGVNEPLWEGVLGLVAAVMVTSLTIHMWKHGRTMKSEMETKLGAISQTKAATSSMALGVFSFTVFMITREGMETALMLIQVPHGKIFAGVFFGLIATLAFCMIWVKFSSYVNVKLFFQVTGVFLLLFVLQILIYAFHELAEAGVIPNSEAFHTATEPFSPDGIYGRWFSVVTIGISALWLCGSWLGHKLGIIKGK